MPLSVLQKYILKQCYLEGKKLNRNKLVDFYNNRKNSPKSADQVNIVTKSVDRLIAHGLVVGYGTKTAEKWFVREIRLTPTGKKETRKMLGNQLKLKI